MENSFEMVEFLYYTPGEWDKKGQFWPVRGGLNTAKPGYHVGPKQIECYSIHFVRRGSLMVEYEGLQKLLNAGDAFCLYPQRSYIYYNYQQNQVLEMSWLAMDGPGIEQMLDKVGFSPEYPFVANRWTPSVQEPLSMMMERMRRETATAISLSLEMQSLLYRFFAELVKEEIFSFKNASKSVDWVRKSLDYMDLHATEGISVQHVAEVIGMNRTYFSSVFTKQVGMTPVKYISMIKMNKAQRMLDETSASITEIAYSLGYPNLFSFTRAFKKNFLLSPSDYRRGN